MDCLIGNSLGVRVSEDDLQKSFCDEITFKSSLSMEMIFFKLSGRNAQSSEHYHFEIFVP